MIDGALKYGVGYDLHLRKGKYYISVKAPSNIAHFYSEGRYRLSSGTSDKALANEKATILLGKIYAHFDYSNERLDPFVEELRPYLEICGVDVNDWYKEDSNISHEFYGEDTWLWQVTDGKYEFAKREDLGFWELPKPPDEWEAKQSKTSEPRAKSRATDTGYSSLDNDWHSYFEEVVCRERLQLAQLVTRLGYAVPKKAMGFLDPKELEAVEELKKPLVPDIKKFGELMGDANFRDSQWSEHLTQNLDTISKAPLVKVAEVAHARTKFSDLVEPYLESNSSEGRKEQSQRRKACELVLELCGDLPLDQYQKLHAHDIGRAMHQDGYSNSQIKKMITYGRGLFRYATTTRDSFGQQNLKEQPWHDVSLKKYGVEKRNYKPLLQDELFSLFAQQMNAQDRLLLSILIATGMRLDEAALLTWDRIREQDGVLSFSLIEDGLKIKNESSRRYIPVPEIVRPMLGNGGEGRLFDYRLSSEGKATAKASDKLRVHIRKVTKDDRKVVHSLRGNFKDLLRSLKVTKETNDYITGHAAGDAAGKYGEGPSMSVRAEAINAIKHPWLDQT